MPDLAFIVYAVCGAALAIMLIWGLVMLFEWIYRNWGSPWL